jgi:hypothetical protein
LGDARTGWHSACASRPLLHLAAHRRHRCCCSWFLCAGVQVWRHFHQQPGAPDTHTSHDTGGPLLTRWGWPWHMQQSSVAVQLAFPHGPLPVQICFFCVANPSTAVCCCSCCCTDLPMPPVPPAGLLLEIASIIHGQGLSVVEGVIRGGSESPITADMVSDQTQIPDPPLGRRTMRCGDC